MLDPTLEFLHGLLKESLSKKVLGLLSVSYITFFLTSYYYNEKLEQKDREISFIKLKHQSDKSSLVLKYERMLSEPRSSEKKTDVGKYSVEKEKYANNEPQRETLFPELKREEKFEYTLEGTKWNSLCISCALKDRQRIITLENEGRLGVRTTLEYEFYYGENKWFLDDRKLVLDYGVAIEEFNLPTKNPDKLHGVYMGGETHLVSLKSIVD